MQSSYNASELPGETPLSTQFSNERYAAAKYLLRPLLGYVKADVIEQKLDTILTMVDDEVIQGAYINSEDDYILLTTRSIYWKEAGKEGRHFPYRQIEDLEIARSEEPHLFLRLTMKNAETISVPLLNDRFESNFDVPTFKIPASPESLQDLAKNYLLPLDKVPEICQWILSGNPDSTTLTRFDIRPEELNYSFLYLLLDGLDAWLTEAVTTTSTKQRSNRSGDNLCSLPNFASREELIKHGKSEEECPPELIGIYVNDDSYFLIIESSRLIEYRLSSSIIIEYQDILSCEVDSSGSLALVLRHGDTHILPIENKIEGLQESNVFKEFFDCITSSPDIKAIKDLESLVSFLADAGMELPWLDGVVEAISRIDRGIHQEPLSNITRSISDYRLIGLLLTAPYINCNNN